jgi:hypothetical protein
VGVDKAYILDSLAQIRCYQTKQWSLILTLFLTKSYAKS